MKTTNGGARAGRTVVLPPTQQARIAALAVESACAGHGGRGRFEITDCSMSTDGGASWTQSVSVRCPIRIGSHSIRSTGDAPL